MNLSQLIPSLLILARKAGEKILEIYQQNRQYPIKTKADHSPLTQADLIANTLLTEGLQRLTPQIPVLSEESVTIPWEMRRNWDTYWLIDPLDGTLPFIQHTGEFTVNIAFIQNHKPILGIIYVPVAEECYYAHLEAGANKIDSHGRSHPIKVHPWRESHTIILASHGAMRNRLEQRFRHLGQFTMRKLSSAWKFGQLAEGKADISPRFGNTSEWDTAAGQCILEQAGGGIFDLAGNPLRYNTKESLLNPHFIALGDVGRLQSLLPWGEWV